MVESQALRNTCVECGGEGQVPSIIAVQIFLMRVTCPHCDGTGYEKEEDEECKN